MTFHKSIHHTDEANEYHQDSCVSKTMSNMGNINHCVKYIAGIAEGNRELQNISISDIKAHCLEEEKKFTIKHAEELCAKLNNAHREFWMNLNHDSSSLNIGDEFIYQNCVLPETSESFHGHTPTNAWVNKTF
jgi:hypothetical protein